MPIREFIDALDRYYAARKELDTCMAEAGYEAGYWCHRQREMMAGATRSLEVALAAVIDARVREALGQPALETDE